MRPVRPVFVRSVMRFEKREPVRSGTRYPVGGGHHAGLLVDDLEAAQPAIEHVANSGAEHSTALRKTLYLGDIGIAQFDLRRICSRGHEKFVS